MSLVCFGLMKLVQQFPALGNILYNTSIGPLIVGFYFYVFFGLISFSMGAWYCWTQIQKIKTLSSWADIFQNLQVLSGLGLALLGIVIIFGFVMLQINFRG